MVEGSCVIVFLYVALQRILSDFEHFCVPVHWFYSIAPAMLRQASYGTIKIGTYQSLKRLFVERPEGEWGILSHLQTGGGLFVFLFKWFCIRFSAAYL